MTTLRRYGSNYQEIMSTFKILMKAFTCLVLMLTLTIGCTQEKDDDKSESDFCVQERCLRVY